MAQKGQNGAKDGAVIPAKKDPTKKDPSKKADSVIGVELINNSKALFSNIMYNFREVHDLCKDSGLYSQESLLEIDTVAINFRQMGQDTATVARVVADQWLSTTIALYGTIDELDMASLQTKFGKLGGQAKELSDLFRVIARWASWITVQFHEGQTDTVKEADEFKAKFASALKEAERAAKQAKSTVERAQAKLKQAKASSNHWSTVAAGTSWIPFANFGTMGKATHELHDYHDAQDAEMEADRKWDIAKDKLAKATTSNQRALVVASSAADLVVMLKQMEMLCEAIGTFWQLESDLFTARQGRLLNSRDLASIKPALLRFTEEDILFWKKSKKDFSTYANAVTQIMRGFNFTTDARPAPTKEFKCAELNFTMHIPAAVDVKKIEEGKK